MTSTQVPVLVLTSPKQKTEDYIFPHQLPGNNMKHAVWHQLPKNKLKGDQLKCPRIRKGPEQSSSSSSSSSSSDEDIEAGRKIKLKHDYKSKHENWKESTVVNLSYQDLGHDYQVKNFVRVLKLLMSCVQLNLVNNSLKDLKSVNLPSCHSLNLSKNHFETIKNLPKCKALLHLNLTENNISTLDGSEGLKNLQSLDLSLNPIQFQENYRNRVFAQFPNLKYLDGIPLTIDDNPADFNSQNKCVIA